MFCQNQERARLLKDNFPKILLAKFDIMDLKNAILQIEDNDESEPKSNILFLIEDDAYLLNQYRINFHSLTMKHS